MSDWKEYKPGTIWRQLGDTLEFQSVTEGDERPPCGSEICKHLGLRIDHKGGGLRPDHVLQKYEMDVAIEYTAIERFKAFLQGKELPRTRRAIEYRYNWSRPHPNLNPNLMETIVYGTTMISPFGEEG